MTKQWIGNRMYNMDDEVRDYIDRLEDLLLELLEEFEPRQIVKYGVYICGSCYHSSRFSVNDIKHDSKCIWKKAEAFLR